LLSRAALRPAPTQRAGAVRPRPRWRLPSGPGRGGDVDRRNRPCRGRTTARHPLRRPRKGLHAERRALPHPRPLGRPRRAHRGLLGFGQPGRCDLGPAARKGRCVSLYLDHNATSVVRPQAMTAMARAMVVGGNPSSVHASGRAARALVEKAREQVAALIAAPPSTVVFTSGGTESNALAIESAVAAGARRII